MKKNKKTEALGFVLSRKKRRKLKKLTHEIIDDAIERFLEKGGKIKQLKDMDKPTDIDDVEGIVIRQNNPVIDPTVYENKWGWGHH
tara:strand:- start:470 stop:727 length:258 start_codon:yes stop_codon:yes gene_type:complete